MPELILMPRLSEILTEGTIQSWHKKVGDSVKRGDLLAEIETDKACMELESYISGQLLYIGGKEGDKIKVNGLICIIGQANDDISKFISFGNDDSSDIQEDKTIKSPINKIIDNFIFFSYSKNDSEFALKLEKDIRNSGHKIWIDISGIRPGQPWHREIQNALKKSKSILVILSSSSVDSENVLDEIYYGLDKRKNIIPIMIDECEMPYGLHRLHYIDFRTNYDSALKQLLDTFSQLSK